MSEAKEETQETTQAPEINIKVGTNNDLTISTNLPALLAVSLLSAAIDSIATQELGEGADVGEIEQ